MNASARTLIVLHERIAPPVAIAAAKRVEIVGLPCADAATTLPGMAKAVLAELRGRGLDSACVVVGLGERAGAFAQALALEMLGCDLPVAGVAVVTDAALGESPHAAEQGSAAAGRLRAAVDAWTPPEASMLPTRRCPPDQADVAAWIAAALAAAPMPAPPPAAQSLPLKIGGPLRAPVFCIPGAGASIVSFLDLAQATHPQASVYGLQPRGLDGAAPPCTSVETAAASMLPQVLQAAPQGPIRLIGHSFGGWIAFALALMLRERGRTLASVDLLDSGPPTADRAEAECEELDVLLRWVELIQLSSDRPLGIDAAMLRPLPGSARIQRVHQRMIEAGLMPAQSDPRSMLGALRMFAACLRTHYRPAGRYDGVLRVVYLDDPALDAAGNEAEALRMQSGWLAHAPRLQSLRGDGNHMTGIRGRHAQALAERLGLGL